jgi:hypothetical protein
MLRILVVIKTIKRNMKPIVAVFQLCTSSSVLTLTCMNDLTGAKVLTGERILFNAVKDIYFTSKMKFEKLSDYSSVHKKLINFNSCGFILVIIVVNNARV